MENILSFNQVRCGYTAPSFLTTKDRDTVYHTPEDDQPPSSSRWTHRFPFPSRAITGPSVSRSSVPGQYLTVYHLLPQGPYTEPHLLPSSGGKIPRNRMVEEATAHQDIEGASPTPWASHYFRVVVIHFICSGYKEEYNPTLIAVCSSQCFTVIRFQECSQLKGVGPLNPPHHMNMIMVYSCRCRTSEYPFNILINIITQRSLSKLNRVRYGDRL